MMGERDGRIEWHVSCSNSKSTFETVQCGDCLLFCFSSGEKGSYRDGVGACRRYMMCVTVVLQQRCSQGECATRLSTHAI